MTEVPREKTARIYNIWMSGYENDLQICIVDPPRALCERANAADVINDIMEITDAFTASVTVKTNDYISVRIVDVENLLDFLYQLRDRLEAVNIDLLNKTARDSQNWEEYRKNVVELINHVEQMKNILRLLAKLECRLGIRNCPK